MQTTIYNNAPHEVMFKQPVFYRMQFNFNGLREIHQFDYYFKESVDRLQNNDAVALFKIKPHSPEVLNDLYERTC